MGWLLAFQQCEKHWETTRSKWNGLHPRNGEALAQKMMRWQKCRCCSVHLWRLGMVGGKLNQTPKSLNSTGKRELLEILRIWILQDVYIDIYVYRNMLVLLPIIFIAIILITFQTDVHLQKLCKVLRVLTHSHIKLHSSASKLACEVNGTWTGFTWSESSMVSGCKRRKCKRWRQYTQHDFSCCVFEEVSGGFPQHWGLIHHQLWVE